MHYLIFMTTAAPLSKVLYTATATAIGGRNGSVKSDDGTIDMPVTMPKGLGGDAVIPELLAVARFFAPGIKYEEASFGRVISAPEARGTGLGRTLVRTILDEMLRALGPVAVRISAQAHLERFYGEFGFRAVSERYLEDDVPHIAMLRP